MPAATDATVFEALYQAALLALAAGQLAAFVRHRDRVHLLLAGLVAGLVLLSVAGAGHALGLEAPRAGAARRSALVALDAAVALFAFLLARAYLDTPRHAARLDPPLRAMIVLAAVALPLAAPETWTLGLELVGLVSLLGPPLLLGAALAAWRAGFGPAAPYLLAHAILLAGLLAELGDAPLPAGEIGVLAMAGVLACGLPARRRALAPERERRDGDGEEAPSRSAATGRSLRAAREG